MVEEIARIGYLPHEFRCLRAEASAQRQTPSEWCGETRLDKAAVDQLRATLRGLATRGCLLDRSEDVDGYGAVMRSRVWSCQNNAKSAMSTVSAQKIQCLKPIRPSTPNMSAQPGIASAITAYAV